MDQDGASRSGARHDASETPRRGHKRAAAGTGLRLYNTLTRRVETITPLRPGAIGLYSCGPTVYRYVHIGNLRTFLMADWIRRALTAQGLRVTHIKNITDVGHMRQDVLDLGEDKLIAQARREGKTPWDIARFYTDAFLNDEARLGILPADVFPRATDHIAEMIALTERLLARGNAYVVGGNVFFAVKTYPAYGQLSGNLLELLGQGLHTPSELSELKRAPEDFPLWKVAEPGRVMAWESPWGRGFPGWHIECSAMSRKYLGEQFELHTGGVDNIFPHHEDERAQSEAASGQPFVRYWVHAQHLLADGLKMAKSAGNAYTLSDIAARGFEPLALRYLFTTALYRSRINFTFRALRAAQTALNRLRGRLYQLHLAAGGRVAPAGAVRALPARAAFYAALRDDLNLPRAMAVVWATLGDAALAPETRLALVYDFDQVLGLDLAADVAGRAATAALEPHAGRWDPDRVAPERASRAANALLARRDELRGSGQFKVADRARQRLATLGYAVRDTRAGSYLVPLDDGPLLSAPGDVPSALREPDTCAFSISLIAHNNRDDLRRCIASIARHAGSRAIELVIVENGSTDATLAYVQGLRRAGAAAGLPARVLLADHDLGHAAARNLTSRASRGRSVVWLDTSIEVTGDIWSPIERLLGDPTIGIVGPYGLVTDDLKEFRAGAGPDVDAVEGYLMALRRARLVEFGPAHERYRFYRLMDLDYSLECKKAGYRVVASAAIAAGVTRHTHREWASLTPDEQATRSKKNFDIFYRRHHHSQSLLVRHHQPGQAAPWGHTHELAAGAMADARYEHPPLAGAAEHTHEHQHWPDHAHSHPHTHGR
ncbi:MAG TPA: cysteine--tRNA ligase [Ktedonobacterales bacterium]